MEKGGGATRRSLLVALRAIRQNNVADDYKDYLKKNIKLLCLYNNVYMYIEWL